MAANPIKVRAYGKIHNFPAGTTPEAIEAALAEHEPILNPEYKAPEPEALDYAKGFASGANKLVSGVGFLTEAAGANETGKAIREFGDRGAKYWNDKMSKGGKAAAQSQVFVDDDNEDSITGIKLSDDWGKALLMGASQSLPSMFAAAIPGVAATRGIQALAKLGLAGGAGATIPLLAGTAAPVGIASNIIARTPSAIGFGAAEGVTAGAMNAADFKTSIESMTDKELVKSPVYRVLREQHGPETARSMLAEQASLDLFGKTALSTGAIGALTGGGALAQSYQKVTAGAKSGLLGTVIKGAGAEALQEAPQSGGEKFIENLATQNFLDPTQSLSEGVATAAASGAAVGGLMGGVIGAGGAINLTPDRRVQVMEEKRKIAEMRASAANARQQEQSMADIGSASDIDQAITAASGAVAKPVVHTNDILRSEDPTLADIEKLTGLKPTEAIDTAINEINYPQPTEIENGDNQTAQQKTTAQAPVLERNAKVTGGGVGGTGGKEKGTTELARAERPVSAGVDTNVQRDKASGTSVKTEAPTESSPVLNAEMFKASDKTGVSHTEYLKSHPNRKQAAAIDVQNVESTLLKGLQKTGKFTATDSKTYAKPFAEFYKVNAERQGILPSELYERMPLKFNGTKSQRLSQDAKVTPASRNKQNFDLKDATPEDFTPDNVGSLLNRKNWAVITASNPASKAQDDAANVKANEKLQKELADKGLAFEVVKGRYPGDKTEMESYLVYGLDQKAANELGNKYGQDSVLTREGLVHQSGKVTPVKAIGKGTPDGYTKVPRTGARFAFDMDWDREASVGDGALSVVARHYSKAPRKALEGSRFGEGYKGGERERIAESDDPRLKSRVDFYVDTGEGVTPETGLGEHIHEKLLHNIYDASTNPKKFKFPSDWLGANTFEKQVLDAGYDGYFTRQGKQGRVVVLGDAAKSIPIEDNNAQSGESELLSQSEGADTSSREIDGSLQGLPRQVGQFNAALHKKAEKVAKAYMKSAGLKYNPPNTYANVNVERAERIATAFDTMKHDPQNPEVKAAYAALVKETAAQYKAVIDSGLKVEFIDFAKTGDPYKGSPRAMTEDVRKNNHMWVFGTRDGFGSSDFDPADNPLLAETEFEISGQKALANDLFRVVHDYFGHVKEGVGFRAAGEENAWRAHMAMFSPEAGRALTTETRGQNSWVNYGPFAEFNKTASGADTKYADQKIGLLPEWVSTEGAGDEEYNQSERLPTTIKVDGKDRPTSDSEGKPISATEAGVRNFWQWFGDSKIVDGQGRPKVMYHGTHSDFSTFKVNEALGGAVFLAPKAAYAKNFAYAKGANILPVYAKVLNPRKGVVLAYNESKILANVKARGQDGAYVRDSMSEENNLAVFESSQIKSAIGNNGEFNPNDPNILKQSGKKEAPERTLLAQHNISVKGLLHADKMGGLASPSLAIADKGKPLTGFGEITLIGDSNLTDPKQGAKVFGADIYSPRYPSVTLTFTKNSVDRLNDKLKPFIEASNSKDIGYYELANAGGEREVTRLMQQEPAVLAALLTEKGVKPKYSEKPKVELKKEFKTFAGATDAQALVSDPDFLKAVRQSHKEFMDEKESGDFMQTDKERFLRNLAYDDAHRVVAYSKYLKGKGKIDPDQSFRSLRDQVDAKNLNGELESYIHDLIKSMRPEEKIFKGFTNSGNRKYIPHTLENIVKELKKNLRGGETFNYGLGTVRSKYTPQFKSLDQIRREKGRLVSDEEFSTIRKEVDDKFFKLGEKLDQYHEAARFDTFAQAAYDAATMGLSRALKENGYSDVPTELVREVSDFLADLAHLPTEYFEVKLPRAVGLSEFSGAVVPKHTPESVINILKKNGITNIKKYKDAEDRKKQIGSFEDQFFQSNFYSALEKEIVNLKKIANKNGEVSVEQAKAWINSRQKEGKFKQAEVEAVGLLDWLDTLEGKVPVADVEEFVQENGVQVEEVVLEGSGQAEIDEDRVWDMARGDFQSSFADDYDSYDNKIFDEAIEEVAGEMLDSYEDSRWGSLLGLNDQEAIDDWQTENEISDTREMSRALKNESDPNAILGEDKYYEIRDDAEESAWERNQDYYLDQARERLENESGGASGGTEFGDYVLRGGGSEYKELLLTLPNSKARFDAPHFDTAQQNGAENIFAHTRINERFLDKPPTEDQLAEKAAYDAKVARLNKLAEPLIAEKKRSATEYDALLKELSKTTSLRRLIDEPTPELAALTAVNEQATEAVRALSKELPGKPYWMVWGGEKERVLFVEEIQSDWAQKGRDEGFAKLTERWRLAYKNGSSLGAAYDTKAEAQEALEDSFPGRESEFELRQEDGEIKGIPSAPFVTDTKAWTGLVAKRLLRYAAENGFDRIAWTAGAQQAERYRLSKFIDSVQATRREDGSYKVSAFDESGTKRVLHENYEANELAGVLGKELAEKIISQPEGEQTYKGLDLDVGGSGMKEFYDRIVPSVFNDISRKLGGDKVETISMGGQSGKVITGLEGRIVITYPNGSYLKNRNTGVMTESQDRADRFDSKEEATKFLDKFEAQNLHEVGRQMSLKITPALKDKVMQGLPLFQRDRAGYNPNTFTISLMEDSDMTSVIHEGGHFYLEALADMASRPDAPEQIVSDFDTTLKWFGIGEPAAQTDATAVRTQGYPVAAGEPIATFTKADDVKAHPGYAEAKAGDDQAAYELVTDLVTQEDLNQAKERFNDATFVPVSLMDKDGANRIPTALAYHYANATGGSVSDSIFESKKAYHTGMNAMERLVSRANFTGKVEPGRKYVLVDDVTTVGSTLADLASYIQSNGGEVVGSVLLANATRSGKMFANAKTTERLENQYAKEIRELFNIEPNALTNEEAQYLIGFRSADELRSSAIKAQGSRLSRIYARQVPERESSVEAKRRREVWQSMSLEQKRPHHEQWAQSFERYALEGVSPTEEMQPVFERFKQWMLETYKSLKEFLKNNPLSGRLNNDVRQVFDRLLASESDIAATAAARGSLKQSGKQQSTQDPTSAAITAARVEMNKEHEEALEEELESIAVTGNGADISLLIASPEYWDPENEELTEAGFAEYDRLNYLLAKERVGVKEVQELSDINSMGQTIQAEAFNAYADVAGLHTNVIYSTGGSRYVEVKVGDSFYKFRFADHFNTVRDSTMSPDFNVAPGRSDFTQAVKFLDDAIKFAKKGEQFNQSGKTKPTIKKGGSTTATPAAPTTPPATPTKPFNPNEDIPETKFRKAQRLSQDSFNRFTVIKEWLAEHGTVLSEKADVFQAEERYNSLVANQLEDFREQQRNPLIEKIAKAGFTLSDVADFLEAQHAREANKAIQDVRSDPTATAYGIADVDAQAYLAKADPKLKKLANELRDITEKSKQMRLDAGLLSQDEVGAWENAYKFYIPVKGDADAKGGTGKGLKVNFKSKRRLGHGKRDEAVIENIFLDHEKAIMQVEKNRVAKHLVMMAAEMNRPEIVSIGQPVKRNTLRSKTAYEVQVDGVTRSVFTTQQAADMFKQLLPTIDKSVKTGSVTVERTNDQRVIGMASPMLAENEINAYIDGHAIRVQINDDLLARAYGKLGVTGFSALVSAGRAFNGYLSKVYTGYNPEFIITNMIRDFTSGLINLTGEEGAKISSKAAKNYVKSFSSLMRYAISNGKKSDKWIDMYRANGGNTGAAYLSDLERLGDEIKTEYASYQGVLANLKSGDIANASRAAGRKVFNITLKWIYNLNQAGENAMRLAAFRAMIESGKTPNQAAKASKNITVNFNRKGEYGAEANAAYLFFNASVQGTAALAHAHFKGKHKVQAWGLSSMMGALGYLAAVALMGDDEDDYDKINDYTKSRNLLIKAGEGYAQIPVPYGYGFFWNTGRAIAEAQKKGELGVLPWHMAASAIEELTPFSDTVVGSQDGFHFDQVLLGLLPTVIKIPAQPAFNKQLFSGGELFPERASQQFQPDREKLWRSTQGTMYDKMAGWLSEANVGDVTPETLKHYTRTFTGGTGALVDATISAAMLKKEGAELEPSEIPFVRKAYSKLTIRENRAAYYKAREEAKKTAEAFSRAKTRNDVTTIDKLVKDEGEMLGLDAYANSLSEAIGAVRDLQDAIRVDDSLNAAEKRVKIKELEIDEQKFYDQYLDVFKIEKMNMKSRKD